MADLLLELRPDVPQPVALSLAVELLDTLADVVLDASWAETRERLYPEAVKLARSRRVYAVEYIERRRRELEAAKPRPGDFPGKPDLYRRALDRADPEVMCDFGPRHDPFWRTGCGVSLSKSPAGCGQGCRAVNRSVS